MRRGGKSVQRSVSRSKAINYSYQVSLEKMFFKLLKFWARKGSRSTCAMFHIWSRMRSKGVGNPIDCFYMSNSLIQRWTSRKRCCVSPHGESVQAVMSKITAYNTPYTSRNGGVRFDSLVIGYFVHIWNCVEGSREKWRKGRVSRSWMALLTWVRVFKRQQCYV